MKILLQHTASRLFYRGADDWVENEGDARVFASALEAIEHCERYQLTGLEILLRRSDPGEPASLGLVPPPRQQSPGLPPG